MAGEITATYTAAELAELFQFVADAADDDPGEVGEILHMDSAAVLRAYQAGRAHQDARGVWVIDPAPLIRLI